MTHRSLLVDTNRGAYPIYQALFQLGHEVWVVGKNPGEPLAKLASNYCQLDYSDVDQLAAFVKEKSFDFLVPGCTDLSYQVCAEINEGRFPGIETLSNTFAINTKSEFRKLSEQLNLPVPRVLTLESAAEAESVIVKPVDSFSGRGMAVLHAPSSSKLAAAYDEACKASRSKTAMIEEFVTGQLYSHSAFVRDGRVVADFVVQEECLTNPFTVDTSRVANDFSREMLSSLRRDVLRLASSLNLTDGLVHTQFIAKEKEYWIIEVTRRCPGDIYSLLIEFSTGYPYAKSYLAPFIGEEALPMENEIKQEWIIRHTLTSRAGSSLWGFCFTHPVDIRLFVPLVTSGDYIAPSPYGRAGVLFLQTSSKDEQNALYQILLNEELYIFN